MNTLAVTFDPHNQYSNLSAADIVEALGLPLDWTLQWSINPQGSLLAWLRAKYIFPAPPIPEATVEDNQMLFPGDPPLSALVRLAIGPTTYLQFPYGLLAVQEDGGWTVVRMD